MFAISLIASANGNKIIGNVPQFDYEPSNPPSPLDVKNKSIFSILSWVRFRNNQESPEGLNLMNSINDVGEGGLNGPFFNRGG